MNQWMGYLQEAGPHTATTIRTSPGCPRHAHPALRSVPYYYAPPFCLQKCNPPSPSGCSTVCCHAAIFAPPCQSITSQLCSFLAIPQLLVHRSKAMDCSSPRLQLTPPKNSASTTSPPSLCPAPTTPLVRQGSFLFKQIEFVKVQPGLIPSLFRLLFAGRGAATQNIWKMNCNILQHCKD